jgi:glycerophosphoryl diester phosphodiesterase
MLRYLLPLLLLAAGPAQAAPPEIIAHRGASHDAPENTLAAHRLAWEQKADASEFDIYLTKDGHAVVLHDRDTQRTAGVARVAAQSTLAELRALDVGAWKGKQFAGEKIPTLAEMLAAVPAGKRVFIEVKCGKEAVPELVRVLAAAQLKPEQTPVICFSAEVVAAFKKARPDVPAYWLVNLNRKGEQPPVAAALVERARGMGADGLDVSDGPALDAGFVKAVRAAGLKLYVWTVDDPKAAKRLATLAVDGITTNRPAWLRQRLEE